MTLGLARALAGVQSSIVPDAKEHYQQNLKMKAKFENEGTF